ncbi:MAG: DNA polymerase III subunit gamma/tau [Desulfuromonadales bacterium]
MSYLVLARKWRPQTFTDLVGQEHVGRTLANAIDGGRVHHAFLFTGARGVGKTSAARILAKALNCETGPTATPCNECPSCLEIAAGNNGAVLEIDGASNTGVDDIRDLRENIRYLPARGRHKIFIIDEVHMLSINAFNALLKTLEEPPEHAKFILATTEPHKIPVTILSRCQRFDFRKIGLGRLTERLRTIVKAENVEISDPALTLVARRGEGSMRDALSTLDQVIAFCGDQVTDEEVQGLLGMVDRRLLLDTLEGVLQRDSYRALEAVRRLDNLGHSFRRFCQELVEQFRSLILFKVMDDPGEILEVTPEEKRDLKALADSSDLADLERALTLLMKTEGELASSAYPRLAMEMALIRLSQLPPAVEVSQLLNRLDSLERHLAAPAAPGRAAAPPSPPPPREEEPPPKKASAPAPAANGEKGWPGLVDAVKSSRPLIGSLLEHGSLLALELPRLEIGFPAGSFHLDRVHEEDIRLSLEKMAADFFGEPVKIKVSGIDGEKTRESPSLLETRKARATDSKRELRESVLSDPMVKAALDIFGGELKDVRPLRQPEGKTKNDSPSG